jgi:hypothetical protein
MVRIIFFLILLVVVAVAVWALLPHLYQQLCRPAKTAPNMRWAHYYRTLAKHARRNGDIGTATDYEGIARTYEWLDEEERSGDR